MNKIKWVLAICCLSVNAFSQPAFVQDSLDSWIKREMERWHVPGLAIAVVKDGKIVVCKGYGVKEAGKKDAVNEFTLFQIASNSKAFTGTAISLLNHEKRVLLDEKVTKYLPWFKLFEPTSTELCTVRDLLCHRLGMYTFQGDFLNWGSNLTRKEIVEHMRLTKPIYPFRYKYGYCNAGFVAASEIIKQVTDTSWDDFIRHRIFDSLEMKHTHSNTAAMANDKNACKPHTMLHSKLVTMPLTTIDNMSGSAAIISNVHDMANWLLMQLDSGRFNGKRVLPWQVIAETRRANMLASDAGSRLYKTKHFSTYGLGWFSYDYEARRIWEHSGGSNGFVTKTEFVPEENLGVLVYTNSDANSLYEALAKQVIEAYFKMPYRNISAIYFEGNEQNAKAEEMEFDSLLRVAAVHAHDELNVNAMTGEYENELYGKIEIRAEKGQLAIYFSHHPNNIGRLKYLGDNKFLCSYTDITCGDQVLPVEMVNGKAVAITLKVNSFIDYQPYVFKRIP